MGVSDTIDSGDSLSYQLTAALGGAASSVTYSGMFAPVRPLTFFGFPNQNLSWPAGLHFDPSTGDLACRLTSINQVAIVAVEVKEWRKLNGVMMVIGITRRDIPIFVIACQNNKIPKLKPPYSSQACVGKTTCIKIEIDDDDANDTVRISWNGGIPAATFTNTNGSTRFASGEVCWTPSKNDVSNVPYTFTITAKDDACPISGTQTRAYSIFVRETPEAELFDTLLTCGRVALDYQITQNTSGFQARYDIVDTNGKL